MKTDGSILIDTKIIDGGMEKGFELIKDEMSSIGITAKEVGEQIELSFSKMDVSKPIANAVAKVEQLERQLAAVTSDYKLSVSEGDDKSAERLAAKRISVYERLEAAREKLSIELAAAVQKEAIAEEKATQRAIKAAEKEAAAKKRAQEKQFNEMTKPVRRFNSRLRELVSGALVFNLISAGLRGMTSYFGKALKSNDEFSKSLANLRGSLLMAFQPIYESAVPALTTLINWLNIGVQALARFFATLSGKSIEDIRDNAESLEDETSAIDGVGGAAKKAARQLAGFDEINKLASETSGGGGGSYENPIFDLVNIPSDWETVIDSLAMRIKDIFFEWENMTPEIVAQKLITALGIITGGLIGLAIGGPAGALVGMTVGAGLGVVLSNVIFNGDGKLSGEEFVKSLVSALLIIGGAVIGFAIGGPGGAAIGATIGLGLTFAVSKVEFKDVEETCKDLSEKIVDFFTKASLGVVGSFFYAKTHINEEFLPNVSQGAENAAAGIADSFDNAGQNIRSTFAGNTAPGFRNAVNGMEQDAADAAAGIEQDFSTANDGIITKWGDTPNWFLSNIIQPIANFFYDLYAEIVRVIDYIGGLFGSGPSVASYAVPSAVSAVSYAATPDVPHLARGAVIPPNKEFLAVLGDQKSGTNIEAPLTTIQEAVRAEIGSQLSMTNELLQRILEKDTDVILDGEKVSRSVTAHQRRTARANGY